MPPFSEIAPRAQITELPRPVTSELISPAIQERLIKCAKDGDLEGLTRCVELGGNLKGRGYQAFFEASKAGALLAVQYIFKNESLPKEVITDAMLVAAEFGNLDVVRCLVEAGADIHFKEDYAFRFAVRNGHLETVKFLLGKGADIHADQDFALSHASMNGHIDIVKFLIKNKCDANAKNGGALILASEVGHLEIVKFLIEKGADVRADDEDALKVAAENGHLEVLIYLVDKFGITPPAMTYGLRASSRNGHTEVVRFLVEKGGEINMPDLSPLREASKNGHLEIVKFLLEKKVDIHGNCDAALRGASQDGHFEVVKFLIENGADVHADNDYALGSAAQIGNTHIVKYLIEKGADIHAENDAALRGASEGGHLELVKFFLDKGADIHAQTDYAIRSASEHGHLDVVKYLIDHGADIHASNGYALSLAARNGHFEIVNYLIKKGADVHLDNENVLKGAMENDQLISAAILLSNGSIPSNVLLEHVSLTGQIMLDRASFLYGSESASIKERAIGILNELGIDWKENKERLNAALQGKHWHETPFYRLGIFISYVSSVLSNALPQMEKTADELFRSLFKRELLSFVPDGNHTWNKHVENLYKELPEVSGLVDVVVELSEGLIMPLSASRLSGKGPIRAMSKELVSLIRGASYRLALNLFTEERKLGELFKFSRVWHRPDKRVPASLRPLLALKSWNGLFESHSQANGVTIECLCSQDDLTKEGAALKHCVGSGSYARSCAEGDTQIVSIKKDGVSLGTIELRRAPRGEIKHPDGTFWTVHQFRGSSNSQPPIEARNAWTEFIQSTKNNKVNFLRRDGGFNKNADKYISPFEKVTGVPLDEDPSGLTEHLGGLAIRNGKSKYFLSFSRLSESVQRLSESLR